MVILGYIGFFDLCLGRATTKFVAEAKVHYPIPVHLQKAARSLGYKEGDSPVSEEHAKTAITLPGHQHLTDDQIAYTIEIVRKFCLGQDFPSLLQ